MSLFQVLKDRLAFATAIFVFWWSLPLGVIFGSWGHSRKNRNDLFSWSQFLTGFFKARFYQVGEQGCYKENPCIWLCNHRDWADFFVDLYVSEGRAGFLSRYAVLIAFPLFGIFGILSQTVIFFRRNSKGRDFTKFNQLITQQLQTCPYFGLVVYPEGTRSIKPKSLPLRRGMLRYAYSENTPVQIIITTNKEHILSQKMMKACFGVKCLVGYSPAIDPTDYSNFDLFYQEIQKEWEIQWERTYSADIRDAVEITRSHMRITCPLYSFSQTRFLVAMGYAYLTCVFMIAAIAFMAVSAQKVLGIHIAPFGDFQKDCLILSMFIALSIAFTKMWMRKED